MTDEIKFSRRERQLLPLLAAGLANKEIAAKCFLAEQTVKNHVYRMMRKAGAVNRFDLAARFLECCPTCGRKRDVS